ncbi:hypothetical protein EYF80_019708 [Liparis tanakae]|uniref:Uncharacterized protein n=1 Tax=Liparis tanakae TaxID=230148 RepID=A0A4Z2HYL7_9TELE|nr:hypothetical protein EYF80_019708 [Liparis tanakae]
MLVSPVAPELVVEAQQAAVLVQRGACASPTVTRMLHSVSPLKSPDASISSPSMPTPKKHPHLVPLVLHRSQELHQNRDQVEESGSDPQPSARPQNPRT